LNVLKICIIGILDNVPQFNPQIINVITKADFFAGGDRHFHLVKDWIPSDCTWITINAPLSGLFQSIKESPGNWVVFASGDPWFYGIANTFARELPDAGIVVFPCFNSLQLLGQRMGINYGEFKTVSLTGRPWHELDAALISGERKLGILTDRVKNPSEIAKRMIIFGYNGYRMFYGEHLGGKDEYCTVLSLSEASTFAFKYPNCFFLEKITEDVPRKMIPETDFKLLDYRPNMITKMSIRLVSLAALNLAGKKVFWDIGACTGSISIEAKLNFPHLQVVAFERVYERVKVFESNAIRFQCPGITLIAEDYTDNGKCNLPSPDAVFLGGYNNRMEEILNDVSFRLPPGGVIAFNSVSKKSKNLFLNWAGSKNYTVCFNQTILVDAHNPVEILTVIKSNE